MRGLVSGNDVVGAEPFKRAFDRETDALGAAVEPAPAGV